MKARILISLRNLVWNARKKWNRDKFEAERDAYFCNRISLSRFLGSVEDFEKQFEKFVGILSCIPYNGYPEIDCLLQYEEEGQLCSMHWYLSDKYQLHVRFFRPTDDVGAYMSDIEIRAHVEIRPDYDPVAHIKGAELRSGCSEMEQILHIAETIIYK